MRYFWDAAADVRPEGADQDEGLRFPFCNAAGLEALFTEAGFSDGQHPRDRRTDCV